MSVKPLSLHIAPLQLLYHASAQGSPHRGALSLEPIIYKSSYPPSVRARCPQPGCHEATRAIISGNHPGEPSSALLPHHLKGQAGLWQAERSKAEATCHIRRVATCVKGAVRPAPHPSAWDAQNTLVSHPAASSLSAYGSQPTIQPP